MGRSQSTMRHFLRLKLPIVQFHNPHIRVAFDQRREADVKAAIHCDTAHGRVTLYPADIGMDTAVLERLTLVGRAQSEAALREAAALGGEFTAADAREAAEEADRGGGEATLRG